MVFYLIYHQISYNWFKKYDKLQIKRILVMNQMKLCMKIIFPFYHCATINYNSCNLFIIQMEYHFVLFLKSTNKIQRIVYLRHLSSSSIKLSFKICNLNCENSRYSHINFILFSLAVSICKETLANEERNCNNRYMKIFIN